MFLVYFGAKNRLNYYFIQFLIIKFSADEGDEVFIVTLLSFLSQNRKGYVTSHFFLRATNRQMKYKVTTQDIQI